MVAINLPQEFKGKCAKVINEAKEQSAKYAWAPLGEAFITGIHVKMAHKLAKIFGQRIGMDEIKEMVKCAVFNWLTTIMIISFIYQPASVRYAGMTEHIGWELANRFYVRYYFENRERFC